MINSISKPPITKWVFWEKQGCKYFKSISDFNYSKFVCLVISEECGLLMLMGNKDLRASKRGGGEMVQHWGKWNFFISRRIFNRLIEGGKKNNICSLLVVEITPMFLYLFYVSIILLLTFNTIHFHQGCPILFLEIYCPRGITVSEHPGTDESDV